MTRYRVRYEVTVEQSIEVEADDVNDAEGNAQALLAGLYPYEAVAILGTDELA